MSVLLARKCCCVTEPPFPVCGGTNLNLLPDTRDVTVSESHIHRKLWWFYFRVPYAIGGCMWDPSGPVGQEGGTYPPGWFNSENCPPPGTTPGALASSIQCFGGMLESRGYSLSESSWSATATLQKQYASTSIPAYTSSIAATQLYTGDAIASWSFNRDVNELSSPTCTGAGGATIDLGWPYNVFLSGPPCADSGLMVVRIRVYCIEASRVAWFRDLCGDLIEPQQSLGHYYILRASLVEPNEQNDFPACGAPEGSSGIYTSPVSIPTWHNTYVSMDGIVFGNYVPAAFVPAIDGASAEYLEWCDTQLTWPTPLYCNGQTETFGYGGQNQFGNSGDCAVPVQDSHQGTVTI